MELGTLLCAWLGLPPGAWPPDHYALLGLARGIGEFADIEGRVLDRMELLRPYQLVHPDATTEGMNRLAQALVCLTDPVARADYDRALGVAPPPFEVVEDEPILIAEIVEPAYEVVEEPAAPPYEVVEAPRGPAYEVVPGREPEVVAPARVPPVPLSRRIVYRRLAALRRAIRAWERLRPVMGTPNEVLATPVAVLLFLRALDDARRALPQVTFALRGSGRVVAALVRTPNALHTLRVLLPSQRAAVALDWRRGYDALRAERDRLRAVARTGRAKRRLRVVPDFLRAMNRTPEWLLVALALAVLLVALVRHNG